MCMPVVNTLYRYAAAIGDMLSLTVTREPGYVIKTCLVQRSSDRGHNDLMFQSNSSSN